MKKTEKIKKNPISELEEATFHGHSEDNIETRWIILFPYVFKSSDEMDWPFKKHLLKFMLEEIFTDGYTFCKEFELIINSILKYTSPGLNGFTAEFCQTFKEEMKHISYKLFQRFQNLETEKINPDLGITLTPMWRKLQENKVQATISHEYISKTSQIWEVHIFDVWFQQHIVKRIPNYQQEWLSQLI